MTTFFPYLFLATCIIVLSLLFVDNLVLPFLRRKHEETLLKSILELRTIIATSLNKEEQNAAFYMLNSASIAYKYSNSLTVAYFSSIRFFSKKSDAFVMQSDSYLTPRLKEIDTVLSESIIKIVLINSWFIYMLFPVFRLFSLKMPTVRDIKQAKFVTKVLQDFAPRSYSSDIGSLERNLVC